MKKIDIHDTKPGFATNINEFEEPHNDPKHDDNSACLPDAGSATNPSWTPIRADHWSNNAQGKMHKATPSSFSTITLIISLSYRNSSKTVNGSQLGDEKKSLVEVNQASISLVPYSETLYMQTNNTVHFSWSEINNENKQF